jgi:hypothetical protein
VSESEVPECCGHKMTPVGFGGDNLNVSIDQISDREWVVSTLDKRGVWVKIRFQSEAPIRVQSQTNGVYGDPEEVPPAN